MKLGRTLFAVIALGICGLGSGARADGLPTDPGRWIVGGSASLSQAGGELYEGSRGGGQTGLGLSTQLSRFVAPGFALGATVLYSYSSNDDFSTTQWGFGPMVRWFLPLVRPERGARGAVFLLAGVSGAWQWATSDPKFDSLDYEVTSRTLQFEAGLAQLLSESIAGTATLNFALIDQDMDIGPSEESAGGHVLSFRLGFMMFL